jgi:hypothetical protein
MLDSPPTFASDVAIEADADDGANEVNEAGKFDEANDATRPMKMKSMICVWPRHIMWPMKPTMLGGLLEKTLPRKNIAGNHNFLSSRRCQKSLDASPGSASNLLCRFPFCANFGNETLSPIMIPLPRNRMLTI